MTRISVIALVTAPLLAAGSSFHCHDLIRALEHHDDVELNMLCRSRLLKEECESILGTLGQRPWSKETRDKTCTAHEDLLVRKRILVDERQVPTLDVDKLVRNVKAEAASEQGSRGEYHALNAQISALFKATPGLRSELRDEAQGAGVQVLQGSGAAAANNVAQQAAESATGTKDMDQTLEDKKEAMAQAASDKHAEEVVKKLNESSKPVHKGVVKKLNESSKPVHKAAESTVSTDSNAVYAKKFEEKDVLKTPAPRVFALGVVTGAVGMAFVGAVATAVVRHRHRATSVPIEEVNEMEAALAAE